MGGEPPPPGTRGRRRYLVVNADDFGLGPGINRGIVEGVQRGIVTSTSLMVDAPFSEHAARLSAELPGLSIGLHFELGAADGHLADAATLRDQLESQLDRCERLLGRPPTHVDSHHNVHMDDRLLPVFLECANRRRIPLRGYSAIVYFSGFYGQWGGETHLEHIGVASLKRMLAADIGEGCTELGCHPGYVDGKWRSGYSVERETELRTLCDPAIRNCLDSLAITLVNFEQAADLAVAR
jgi:chitin disaccharide deacetylase